MFIALQAIYSIGSLAIGLPLIFIFHAPILAAIWSATAASLLGIIVVLALLGLHRAIGAGIKPGGIRELMAFAWPMALGGVSLWSFRLSDRYVLGAFVSTTEVGIYSSVFDLAERFVSAVREPILLTIQPMAIHEADGDEGHDSIHALRDGTAAYMAVGGLLALLMILLGPTIVQLFLGPAFASGAGLLGTLVVGAVLIGFVHLGVLTLTLAMRPRMVAVSQSGAAVAKLAINLVVIPIGGIWAAAATTLAMNLLLAGFLLATSGERGKGLLRDRLLRRMAACLAASFVIGETAQILLGSHRGATTWSAVVGGLAYAGAMIWVLGFSRARSLMQSITRQQEA